jgi:dipeptidyl aminopeptidase/acylaminoacyl peptidase
MRVISRQYAAIVLTLLAPVAALAQGTAADYVRADSLQERARGKVLRANVQPRWIGQTARFWYRNDRPGGRREFILVDPDRASRARAFDHARMAAALNAVGVKAEAERLPIDSIDVVEQGDRVSFTAGGKSWSVDLKTYEIKPSSAESGAKAREARPDSGRRASRNGGAETNLTFVNRTGATVSLFWLDAAGEKQPYGSLQDGETREQHTFAGHMWLVAGADGRTLAVYEATETPATAILSRQAAPARDAPVRPERPTASPFVSPDRRWRIVFREHNAHLHDNRTGESAPLTTDGTAADAYGGRPAWSPDSRRVAILKTIPAQEHKVHIVESSPRDQLQPRLRTIDYLKPGDRIAHPRPYLVDVGARTVKAVPDALFPTPWSLTDFEWDRDSRRFTFLYNQRGHQVMRLVEVDAETGAARAAIDEQAKTFIDYTNKVYLRRLPGGREALWMSERDGWNHLYLYDLAAGAIKNQVTKGPWLVRAVERVDEEKRQVWFRAMGIRPGQDPYYEHYCRVNFDGSGLTVLTEGDGTHRVQFSPDGRYIVDTWSRVDLPPVTEVRHASDGAKMLELERADASALLAAGIRLPERFTAKGRDGTTDIHGVIIRPTNFDPAKKYPVIENIYAGPQGFFTPKAFSPLTGMHALAELGFIVVQMDGMGTNWRSKAFHDVAWKNLGDAGFPDRIVWIKAAAAKVPQMDLTRVGIYGGSAGGQNALGGMLQHGDFYKAAVSDCGCHDNRMDKIWWNEQWMGWPVGPHYDAQSNVTMAPRLKGKLLLMVGEVDTNVDPASTMQVVNALIRADKDFDLLVAPNVGHGVAGTPYGRRRLRDFFVKHLLGVTPPERNGQ